MKVPSGYRYGCHDREPPRDYVMVQDGWTSGETRNMVRISDDMSKDCRYAIHGYADVDSGCTGCKWLTK